MEKRHELSWSKKPWIIGDKSWINLVWSSLIMVFIHGDFSGKPGQHAKIEWMIMDEAHIFQ